MTHRDKITRFAFVLLAAAAFAPGAQVSAADLVPTDVGEAPTPNHDPHPVGLVQTVATPNHDPHPVSLAQTVATPNHDPHPVSLAQTDAWNPMLLRAEPEAAAPSAPAFVATRTMLSAKANARLRAGPSLAAGIVAKLAANTPLRAVARSTDGAWWQVSLADKRTAYVHRDAVTKYAVTKAKPAAVPAAVAAASPQPAPARRSQGPLGFVEDAMNWLVDVAGHPHGSPPKIIRTER